MNSLPSPRTPISRSAAAVIVGLLVAALASPATPASAVAGFGDVEREEYWAEPVQWMVDNDITTGTGEGCFSPDDPVTRGQAAAFMYRMEGEPAVSSGHPFTDVTAGWQQDAVAWMVRENVTTGTTPTTYAPDDALTRGQLAALLHRLAGNPAPAAASSHPFGDVFAPWQQAPVSWMVDNSITTGTTASTFSPDDIVSRGQLATFFHRYAGSPSVAIDPLSPLCTGAPIQADPPGPEDPEGPTDCTVGADEPFAAVWFDIHYNDEASDCERPEFIATASNRFVDQNHPSASDSNPGTESLPWRTIVHAAEAAQTGDVVYVKAGVYDDGRIEPRTSGVIFTAYPGDEHEAIIEGWGIRGWKIADFVVHGFFFRDIANNGVQIVGPGTRNVVFANNKTLRTAEAGISIRGILPSKDPGNFDGAQDILVIGNDIRLANLVTSEVLSVGSGVVNIHVVANELSEGDPSLSGGDEGIAFKEGVRDSFIYGNYVHGLSDRGIHIDGGAADWDANVTNIEIFDNLLVGNYNQGLWVTAEGRGDVDGVWIHDNIAIGNRTDGFLVYEHPNGAAAGGTVKNVVFENNIAIGNGEEDWLGGFRSAHPTATGIVFRDNIAWGNGFDMRAESPATFDNNLCSEDVCEIRQDPLFDLATLTLRAGSPAIGAATDGGDLGPG
ncbi:MAG: S-layer homology domain-containing protein [Actinomycetota bacterium]